jgi:hypothetical protein
MTKQDSKWSIALRGHLAQRPTAPDPTDGVKVAQPLTLSTLAPVALPVAMALWSLFILGA